MVIFISVQLVRNYVEELHNIEQAINVFWTESFGYITSFKILENGDYDIILIEEVKDCENKEQLKARERFYIESLECVNKVIVGRTSKEYYEENKVVFAAKNKEHYEANKDTIKAKHREYYIDNNEQIKEHRAKICICNICDCQYTLVNKARHERSIKHQNNLKK